MNNEGEEINCDFSNEKQHDSHTDTHNDDLSENKWNDEENNVVGRDH